MSLFLISALVFGLVMAAMAVGVMNGRAPIKGSCGGNPQRCDEETRDGEAGKKNPELYYPADK